MTPPTSPLHPQTPVAIIGTGPAGLMAAWVVARAGVPVTLFEKRTSPGRKLLLAGSTGLNLTHELPLEDFRKKYKGPPEHFTQILNAFPPQSWLNFVQALGLKTFQGSGHRYFVEGMKASPLVRAWMQTLRELGVSFRPRHECIDFEIIGDRGRDPCPEMPPRTIRIHFADHAPFECQAACLALGGGSYEKHESPLRWPAFFKNRNVRFHEFRPSNTGFEVAWPTGLLAEAEGLPLKNICLTTRLGSKLGDLIVTRYGLEGTPIYQIGEVGTATLDLKPDLSEAEIRKRLEKSRENLSPFRRVKKLLNLCPASLALLFHCVPPTVRSDLNELVRHLKRLPLQLNARRPLTEAISSAGGLDFDELTPQLMLKQYPGIFLAGEMLDWDAPTGGFLIQACAAQGYVAGQGILKHLASAS